MTNKLIISLALCSVALLSSCERKSSKRVIAKHTTIDIVAAPIAPDSIKSSYTADVVVAKFIFKTSMMPKDKYVFFETIGAITNVFVFVDSGTDALYVMEWIDGRAVKAYVHGDDSHLVML